jgi:hypothetical protein
VTPAFAHLLYFGSTRRLTEEELITDGLPTAHFEGG